MKALKCSTSVKRVNVCARPRSDKRGRWWWWSTCRTDGCTGEGTIRSDRQADTATVRPSERQRRSAARRAVQSSFSKADQEREREAGASQVRKAHPCPSAHGRTAHVRPPLPLTTSVSAAAIAIVVAASGARISVRNLQ